MKPPVIPFDTYDDLIHRVSADSNQDWFEDNRDRHDIRLITQCGVTLLGTMYTPNSMALTCFRCITRVVRETNWRYR